MDWTKELKNAPLANKDTPLKRGVLSPNHFSRGDSDYHYPLKTTHLN